MLTSSTRLLHFLPQSSSYFHRPEALIVSPTKNLWSAMQLRVFPLAHFSQKNVRALRHWRKNAWLNIINSSQTSWIKNMPWASWLLWVGEINNGAWRSFLVLRWPDNSLTIVLARRVDSSSLSFFLPSFLPPFQRLTSSSVYSRRSRSFLGIPTLVAVVVLLLMICSEFGSGFLSLAVLACYR